MDRLERQRAAERRRQDPEAIAVYRAKRDEMIELGFDPARAREYAAIAVGISVGDVVAVTEDQPSGTLPAFD
ncbi:MAG: hypothetical protein U0075_00405 [Thermomicrobiales bacterium]